MNRCPFCQEKISLDQILFFTSREGGEHTGYSAQKKQRDDEDFGAGRKFRRGMESAAVEPAAKPAEAAEETKQTESAQQEAEPFIGKWATDEINKDFLNKFLDSGEVNDKNRFIVHWSKEEAARGVGKADKNYVDSTQQLPMSVELCKEDAAIAGTENLTSAMCPHCHCKLPPKYMGIKDENCHAIRLIGYPACGKTQYKLAIREELRKLSVKYQLCEKVEMFSASDDFLIKEDDKFKGGSAQSTDKEQLVFPMVFAIRKKNNDSHLLTIYDLPGEAFREGNEEILVRYSKIGEPDGALLMVDAAQLYGAVRKEKISVASKGHEEETKEVAFDSVEEDVTIFDPLMQLSQYKFCENVEYLALVVTKADLLVGKYGSCFGENNSANLNNLDVCKSDESKNHQKAVNVNTINRVDMQTMQAIRESPTYKDHEDLKQEICDYLGSSKLKKENIRAFTVSTLRRLDTLKTDFVVCDNSKYCRHRVLEPILYLLARWNVVDCTGGENWGEGFTGAASIQEEQPPEKDGKERRGLWGWFRH